jgi:hypothetical protein
MTDKPTAWKSPEMAKKFPLNPKHPERTCWGCDKYCAAGNLQCGNGSGRTEHPAEMLGEDWYKSPEWGIEPTDAPDGDERT